GEDAALVGELVDLLVELRTRARQRKQWEEADLIRDRLGEMGIALEDTPLGTRWRRRRGEEGR
ncbi:MAG TPA: cysteine--tRNA ligase, partial [Firmicutes bacterium]|nr:cysteine--tRNA ligase [Bacillota bacterium]